MLKEIFVQAEHNNEYVLDLTRKLIRAKSVNPPGNTSEAAQIVGEQLEQLGFKVDFIEPSPGRVNVVAVLEGDLPGKSLIFNGHLDVVPPSDLEAWHYDPFDATIVNDRIFGRGASDMKGAVASVVSAAKTLVESLGTNFRGRYIVHAVADEETGGKHGSRYLIENKIIVGDACIIAEPSGDLKTGKYKIVAGEKGVLWAKIICRGQASHGSLPMLGKNAIRELSKTITTLPEVFPTPVRIPEDAKDLIMNGKEWLNNVHPGAGDALDHYTLNIGIIRGGKKVNIVPDYCEIEIDMRIPIGTNSSDAENQLRTFLGTEHEIEIIDKIEPSYTSSSHPLTQAIRNVAEMFLGYAPPCVAMPATSDARLFRKAGIPTINFGPGFLEKAHTENEFVYITDVINFAKIYASFILHYFRERNS